MAGRKQFSVVVVNDDMNSSEVWILEILPKHFKAFKLLETYADKMKSPTRPKEVDTICYHAQTLFLCLHKTKITEGQNTIEIDSPCLRKLLDLEEIQFIAHEMADDMICLPTASDLFDRKRQCPCDELHANKKTCCHNTHIDEED